MPAGGSGFPGGLGLSAIQIDMPLAASGADHVTAHVALRDSDKPVGVTVLLDRTPAGWRVADVVSGSGRSFRAAMAACTAPGR